jgi:mannose-6-phosphate isomerase-like protein (cupin superfamily)
MIIRTACGGEIPRKNIKLTLKVSFLRLVILNPAFRTADEIVFVYKGEGEMYINSKWVPVKAGDLYVCPRGVAHTSRALPGRKLLVKAKI